MIGCELIQCCINSTTTLKYRENVGAWSETGYLHECMLFQNVYPIVGHKARWDSFAVAIFGLYKRSKYRIGKNLLGVFLFQKFSGLPMFGEDLNMLSRIKFGLEKLLNCLKDIGNKH